MSKKPIIGGIILAAIIGVVFVGVQINPDNPENEKSPNSEVWSTRMVGSEVSHSGTSEYRSWPIWNGDAHQYSSITLTIKVPYKFDFVAMGDSPKWIKISVGDFSELLYLEGTLVGTGISEYYTWDYVGNKEFSLTKVCKDCDITVERHGNLEGSVTISLSR